MKLRKIVCQLILIAVLCAPVLGLAYTKKNPTFEPTDPGVGTGTTAVTANSISTYSGLGQRNPVELTVLIINWVLGILGVIFLVLLIYGGIRWMISLGSDAVDTAKDIIKAALIGLIIVLVSYGVSSYIFTLMINVTNARNG